MDRAQAVAVERAMRYMRVRLAEPITVDDVARSAMYSKYHFSRVFHDVTGLSPGQYLMAIRVERARYLLKVTSLPVRHIGASVGYRSFGTFSGTFRRIVGLSPSAYRDWDGRDVSVAIDRAHAAESHLKQQ